jgi:hypothetical protein
LNGCAASDNFDGIVVLDQHVFRKVTDSLVFVFLLLDIQVDDIHHLIIDIMTVFVLNGKGIDAGIMNQGIADYFFEEDEPDRFIRPNYEYVGGVVDYSVFSKNEFTVFARGGLAPAHRRDMYIWHSED